MKHDLWLEGSAYRLRPVTLDDAPFLLALRTDPELSRYLHTTSPRLEDQQRWMAGYFARQDDFYWICETLGGEREGAIAIYDVDLERRQAEWGRWVMRQSSNGAVESALLAYTAGFEELGLRTMYCRTVAINERVVSFHTSCGLETRRIIKDNFEKDGRTYDSVEQVLDRSGWPAVREKLSPLTARLARKRELLA